jgi:predicted transcriptional regulator
MRTVSFKLPEDLDEKLDHLALERGTSRSALVREAIAAMSSRATNSVTVLAGELVGSVDGPADLSTNRGHLRDYGQ